MEIPLSKTYQPLVSTVTSVDDSRGSPIPDICARGSINYHDFRIVGDSHQPSNTVLCTPSIRISVIKGGLTIPNYRELIDPGTYEVDHHPQLRIHQRDHPSGGTDLGLGPKWKVGENANFGTKQLWMEVFANPMDLPCGKQAKTRSQCKVSRKIQPAARTRTSSLPVPPTPIQKIHVQIVDPPGEGAKSSTKRGCKGFSQILKTWIP